MKFFLCIRQELRKYNFIAQYLKKEKMKKYHHNLQPLWMDQYLSNQSESTNQNINNSNSESDNHNKQQPQIVKEKKFFSPVPFAQRFENKIFTFNKSGKMCKLQQIGSMKASLILKSFKTKKLKNSKLIEIMKNKNIQLVQKKQDLTSRNSIQSNQSPRVTRSLQASKISNEVCQKKNKYRYGSDCYSIKQQDIQQTIQKMPSNNKNQRIYTSQRPRKLKNLDNNKRKIYFQQTQSDHYQPAERLKSTPFSLHQQRNLKIKNTIQFTQQLQQKRCSTVLSKNIIMNRKSIIQRGKSLAKDNKLKKLLLISDENNNANQHSKEEKTQNFVFPSIQKHQNNMNPLSSINNKINKIRLNQKKLQRLTQQQNLLTIR